MLDKRTFCKRAIIWTMIITFVIIGAIGLGFGTVIEATLFEEIAKWVVMGLGVSGITGMLAYILSPLVWHMKNDKKSDE
jgi:VIT1/CCC1 family predicted Fe2+/Mn2+ transporter